MNTEQLIELYFKKNPNPENVDYIKGMTTHELTLFTQKNIYLIIESLVVIKKGKAKHGKQK